MNSKKVGIIFLLQVLITIGASIFMSLGGSFLLKGFIPTLIVSEGLIVIPCLIVTLLSEHEGLIDLAPISGATIPLTLLFATLTSPLITLANAISMIFTKNEVVSYSDQVLAMPFWMAFLAIAVLGPLCEELVFRGIFLGALKRSGNVRGAIIVQALLFGLCHMNLNQFCYAFVIGILMGLLVESTGSVLTSFVMHMCINGSSVVLMYLTVGGANLKEVASKPLGMDVLIPVICVYSLISLVTTTLAGCLLYGISKIERRDWLLKRAVFGAGEEEVERVLSVPLLIGVVFAMAMIIVQVILEKML